MPPVRMRGDGRKAKNPRKTLLRLLGYMKPYLPTLGVVLLCIIANAVAQTTGSRSLGTLVDSYILPMVRDGSTDFSSLWGYLSKLACIFAVGMISSFLFMFLMVKVSQGTQKHIRDEMFAHMQTLPLRYFDTNTAGNIMSRYTSDIDTLRQMISQSIPQCASSLVTIVVVFVGMLQTSWVLTIVMLFTVTGIVFVTMKVAGKSAKYFVGQQQSLGALNGYVEEMVNGQKVVKVFTHEEACKEQFDKLNEELCRNARIAGTLSNMMGPINNNLGYVQYAILAIVGGALCVLSGGNMLSLGSLMSFMLLSRSFNMPISQVSNQINAIVMALAGAERIFELMDEKPETDDGYVQLVNAKIDENGNITETPEHTGHWAWKHPHKADGTVTYTELKGDITMTNVDFGYVPEKLVLHDVTLYAKPGQKIAFVGATGAGKTTITNLINRFYDIDDGKIRYDKIFTSLTKEEIDALITEHRADPGRRMLQKRLGEEVTCMVHSREDYETAVEASNILFGKATKESLLKLDEETLLSVFDGVPQFTVSRDQAVGAKAVDLLAETTKCFASKGEMRKLTQGGGVSINKEKLAAFDQELTTEDLIGGKFLVVQRGKKNYFLITVKD